MTRGARSCSEIREVNDNSLASGDSRGSREEDLGQTAVRATVKTWEDNWINGEVDDKLCCCVQMREGCQTRSERDQEKIRV